MGVKVRERPPGSGVFWIFVDHQGKRKAKKIGDEKTARKVAKKIEAKLVLGDTGLLKPSPTFREVAKRWVENVVDNPEYAPKTQVKYKGILKMYVLPKFGACEIKKITRADIADFLMAARRNKVAVSSIEVRLSVLNGVFKRALAEGILNNIPTLLIKNELRIRKDPVQVDPLTYEESEKVLQVARDKFKPYPWLYPLLATAFKTGLRLGELAGLKWQDIDFNTRYVHVKRSISYYGLRPPKSGKSRKVDLADSLCAVLKDHLKNQKLVCLKRGFGSVPEAVFCDKNGRFLRTNQIGRLWNRVLAKAGIRHFKFHSTRCTYASQLLSRSADIYYVSRQLGHSSIKMTEDRYLSWIPEKNKDLQVNLLDASATQPMRNLSKK